MRLNARLCGRGIERRLRHHAVYPHWTLDVLQCLRSQILERDIQLVGDMLAHRFRDDDTARRGQRLQAGGDIDAVAVDVGLIRHDVTEMDRDPES